MKYYVVSDVHSFYKEMRRVLSRKGFFRDEEPHKLIVCGDLFDRGTESVKMQNFISDLMAKDEVILIRGNHEDLILELIENADMYFSRDIRKTHHWSNGTLETVGALTGMDVLNDDYKQIMDKLKETPYIKEIIPCMLNYYETEHYIFVHGWIPSVTISSYWEDGYLPYPDWRHASKKMWDEARWINGMFAYFQGITEVGKTIVCGHYHCSWGHYFLGDAKSEFDDGSKFTPFRRNGIIAIDACTAYTKKVNCIVLED